MQYLMHIFFQEGKNSTFLECFPRLEEKCKKCCEIFRRFKNGLIKSLCKIDFFQFLIKYFLSKYISMRVNSSILQLFLRLWGLGLSGVSTHPDSIVNKFWHFSRFVFLFIIYQCSILLSSLKEKLTHTVGNIEPKFSKRYFPICKVLEEMRQVFN